MISGPNNALGLSLDDFKLDWMKATFQTITSLIPLCLEVPEFSNMRKSSISLNIDKQGTWIPTGVYVKQDKLLQMDWSTQSVVSRPSKYKVLYRIDPRFEVPQVFIQKYDYSLDRYVSDFHAYKSNLLVKYQNVPEMTFPNRVKDYTDYFKFVGRSKILVKKNDVINITLDQSASYFGIDSEMNRELGSLDNLSVIYTQSPLPDNRMIYSNPLDFCNSVIVPAKYSSDNKLIKEAGSTYAANCSNANSYRDFSDNNQILEGRINNPDFSINISNINPCADGATSRNNTPLCYFDKARGLQLSVGGTIIKNTTEKFVNSPYTGKDFFYYKSNIDGALDFNTSWPINGMVSGYNQYMKDWVSNTTYDQFLTSYNNAKPNIFLNFLYTGRYLLNVEVGKSVGLTQADLSTLGIEYTVLSNGVPLSGANSTTVGQSFRDNANAEGYLWLRVKNNNIDNITGFLKVNITNYSGTTWCSDLIYGELIQPLRLKFNQISMLIYHKLITDATFQGIARTMLVLYIIIYALAFLAGATEITVADIVTRVLKIGVILTLFSETSWTFFNQYLFNFFIAGSDTLLTNVIGSTSQVGNVFGFIDPIFDKFTNDRVWALLAIQLLQIHTGLTFFALMTIYGILLFFRAALEVIVSYCLAFLGLAIMVSLAPFFIVLILFERTRSMFDNWLSLMFSYMISPTILMIFFLLIDQIMTEQIASLVIRACWDTLIPIKIGLNLFNMGIPLNFSFALPFLPGIPFYVPQIAPIETIADFFSKSGTLSVVATSSLLFFALCKLSSGSVDYVTLLVSMLTNVINARQEGKLQQNESPIHSITGDINRLARPITGIPRKVVNFAREKGIDQKISHRGNKDIKEADYKNFTPNQEAGGSGSKEANNNVESNVKDNVSSGKSWIKPASDAISTSDTNASSAKSSQDSSRLKMIDNNKNNNGNANVEISANRKDLAIKPLISEEELLSKHDNPPDGTISPSEAERRKLSSEALDVSKGGGLNERAPKKGLSINAEVDKPSNSNNNKGDNSDKISNDSPSKPKEAERRHSDKLQKGEGNEK